jgi:hypothetical protein
MLEKLRGDESAASRAIFVWTGHDNRLLSLQPAWAAAAIKRKEAA